MDPTIPRITPVQPTNCGPASRYIGKTNIAVPMLVELGFTLQLGGSNVVASARSVKERKSNPQTW